MSDSKRSILVSIIRKAVGLPTGAQSCCGAGVVVAEKSADSCCDGGAGQAKQPPVSSCCSTGAKPEQSGSSCCGR